MEPKTSPMPTSSPRKKIIIIVITILIILSIAAGIYFGFFYKRNPTDQELRQQYNSQVQTKLREALGSYLTESPVAPISVVDAKKMNESIKASVSSTAPISQEGKQLLNAAIADVVSSQEQTYQDWKKAQLEKK